MGWLTIFLYGLFAVGTLGAVWAATGAVLSSLSARAILDHPNERSSHSTPTPRGAGLAVIGVLLAAWCLVAALTGRLGLYWPVFLAALAIAAVSWRDDLHGLPAWPRLIVQALAVAVGMTALPVDGLIFQGLLPPAMDTAVAALGWLWFINLFNFMDGIDGISAVETAAIGGGLCLVALIGGMVDGAGLYGLILAAAALGYLPWNWHPARIFLGDVGSVTLGYLIGWLLLGAAAEGYWAAALLLPLYYLADATLTLASRLRRREPVWQAHRKHYYQRAVRRGMSQTRVVGAVIAIDGLLIGLALLSLTSPLAALAIGALSVIGLLWYFRGSSGDY
jgi:UDP-N-acetylmuramyl pentapeptide phosphotransferase/UDP-N-acetylglucosamine-1-phosphate transferase